MQCFLLSMFVQRFANTNAIDINQNIGLNHTSHIHTFHILNIYSEINYDIYGRS